MDTGREFWNKKFKGSVEEWKIDYDPETLFKEHGLPIPQGLTVMDFGVGRGDFARFCKQRGNIVICCDVAEEALHGVYGVADECLLYDEAIDNLPPVDLAIANLVFQHCSDEVVLRIMKGIRLKPGGVFSFQFAEVYPPLPQWIVDQTSTGYLTFRSPTKMKLMVLESNNLWVERVSEPIPQRWPDVAMDHFFVRCRAK